MKEEGASEEEIQDELAIINTQLAYVYQMQDKNDDAFNLYNVVLKAKYVHPLSDLRACINRNFIGPLMKAYLQWHQTM